MSASGHDESRGALDLAARIALRAQGLVEPNPLVGCVLVRPGPQPWAERIIGVGHHQRFGHEHAETLALSDAASKGHNPAGATAYVTLEPCNHQGKQPPCTRALIAARVARVVCARHDPNPLASGGAAALRAAGIPCEFSSASPAATHLADAFFTNVTRARPFITAKWAQSIDGKIATRDGESQWISGPRSRRRVHRLRARADAVIVGIGTLLADDPRLTARGTPIRRVASRVIVDPSLRTPDHARLFDDLPRAPVIIISSAAAIDAQTARVAALRARGVHVLPTPHVQAANPAWQTLDLAHALAHLYTHLQITTALVEGGPRLLGSLLAADLIDEAQVYTAPILMGDADAVAPIDGPELPRLALARRWTLLRAGRIDHDLLAVYRRPVPDLTPGSTLPA